MSRNDQLLVKEYKGKFYVFDVMAESWDDPTGSNRLSLTEAKKSFNTREDAHTFAHSLDDEDDFGGSEYGVVDEVLYKDGAEVIIVEEQL